METTFPLETFEASREALTRAAYRALLRREPETAAQATFKQPPFSQKQEDELSILLERFISGDEYQAHLTARPIPPAYPPSTWVMAEFDGLKMWVDIGDMGVSRHCAVGCYEPYETAILMDALPPGGTFVDIGANIGWFSLNAAKRVGPTGHVFAFEPREDSFHALDRTMAENGFQDRATLIQAAVGEAPGEIVIGWETSDANPGHTLTLSSPAIENEYRELGAYLQKAPVVVLDDIIKDHPVHALKIDIEGAEPIALRGAANILRNQRPLILCEVHPQMLGKVSGTNPTDFFQFMKSYGYGAYNIATDGIGQSTSPEIFTRHVELLNIVFKPE